LTGFSNSKYHDMYEALLNVWKKLENSCDTVEYRVYTTQRIQKIVVGDWIIKRAVLVNTGSIEFNVEKEDGTISGCFYKTKTGIMAFSFLAFSSFLNYLRKNNLIDDTDVFGDMRRKIKTIRKGFNALSRKWLIISSGQYMYRVISNLDGFLVEVADLQNDEYNSTEFGNHIIGFIDIYNDDKLVTKAYRGVELERVIKAFDDLYFVFLCGVDDYILSK